MIQAQGAPQVDHLAEEMAELRARLERSERTVEHLRQRVAGLEEEGARVCEELVRAEDKASELVQQHATLRQIHAAPTRAAFLQALQEVIINVTGSEEFAIFELKDGALQLARVFGLDPLPLRAVRLGQGVIGTVASSGKRWVAGRDGATPADGLTACIPLISGGQVVGVIAVFQLLPHKPELLESDDEIFDLLTVHAGQALRLQQLTGCTA